MASGVADAPVAVRSLLDEQLEQLMFEARSDDQMDRRGAARYPFFRQVLLLPTTGKLRKHTAFTRELSTTGIGLLHNLPLPPGLVTIVLSTQDGMPVRLPTEILWHRPCGEGWYVSGGKFVRS
ncbi:MAG TPA: PilZ domain-containing protein [Pirellulales bacterium]|nr:PilZ domain-containing protein [Pirellulales bacterium]